MLARTGNCRIGQKRDELEIAEHGMKSVGLEMSKEEK